ncbi:MAG: hypothetical protein FWG39_02225 [Alphaproteobacteria bacterium]|nr:hypothetical protein [Alphaproteobacteria bacterium]
MFIQKFKEEQRLVINNAERYGLFFQEYTLSCQGGDDGRCDGAAYSINITAPCNPSGVNVPFPFPKDKLDDLVKILTECGLPEKCKACLQKVK